MRILSAFIIVASLVAAGCTTDPYTGEERISRTAIGAGVGALLGAAAGGNKHRAEGAVLGAAIGGGTGYYMDHQADKLREKLKNTGVGVTRTAEGITLNMPGNISFPTDQASVLPDFYQVLSSVAVVLKEYKKTRVDVSGYTDSTGSYRHNQTLSEKRAQSVADYLVSQGTVRGRYSVHGFADRYPIADNSTPRGRAMNRRVEIEIIAM
jgi:outer membrane protein OmpA-like peptidoglycan-associated protein